MTPDEARDLFSEAFDGELDQERQAAFEAALADSPELRADYDDFVETFSIVGMLEERDPISVPDLLPKVQDRLRRRSRGRYYRDRFSEKAGRFNWMVMLLACVTVLLVLAATLYAMEVSNLGGDEDGETTTPAASASPTPASR